MKALWAFINITIMQFNQNYLLTNLIIGLIWGICASSLEYFVFFTCFVIFTQTSLDFLQKFVQILQNR